MVGKLFRLANQLKCCLTISFVCETIEFTNYGFYFISVNHFSFFISSKSVQTQNDVGLLKKHFTK